ncbi:MAG: GNAT family N-acetyltransferase [Deltaproteobacteria bacterium]
MPAVRVVTDLDEGKILWRKSFPEETLWDIWDVRECFHRNYQRPLHFLFTENEGGIVEFLPLCLIEEHGYYGYFPGEIWSSRTWIEQNRIKGCGHVSLERLCRQIPGPFQLRYLSPGGAIAADRLPVDEIGYIFVPEHYGHEMANYMKTFSRKAAKGLSREISAIEAVGVTYRLDDPGDFDDMIQMNLRRFGETSYFADERFLRSFRDLRDLLAERGLLRITTILIGGAPVAVDMGAIYRNQYILLAGGAHEDFIGVAKLINQYHIVRACRERLLLVDFLCGDFSWKKLFHLEPRPLYLLTHQNI